MSLVQQIIREVADGSSLKASLARHGLTPSKFHYAISKDREAAQSYIRAQEIRADLLAEQTIEIADGDDDPQKARNRIETRKWLASKHYTKQYGDRLDVNVTQSLDITAALSEARERLRPISDQSKTIDAQFIDITGASGDAANDPQSHGQSIFD